MKRFRWWLSGLLERWAMRLEYWAVEIAPTFPEGMSFEDVLKEIEPMETPLMKRLRGD